MTSEKQTPSALDYLGHFKDAVSIEKRLLKAGASKAMKDILNGLVAQYNKMTSVKRHRIDTPKRALVYNMLLSQVWFVHCMYVLAVFCNISKLV